MLVLGWHEQGTGEGRGIFREGRPKSFCLRRNFARDKAREKQKWDASSRRRDSYFYEVYLQGKEDAGITTGAEEIKNAFDDFVRP